MTKNKWIYWHVEELFDWITNTPNEKKWNICFALWEVFCFSSFTDVLRMAFSSAGSSIYADETVFNKIHFLVSVYPSDKLTVTPKKKQQHLGAIK